MRDSKLTFYDNADISGSPASDVIEVAAATDSAITGALHKYPNNLSGATHLNVVVDTTLTGTETITLEDSADGSSWASTTAVIVLAAAAVAGVVRSIAVPDGVRRFMRVDEAGGSAGNITCFLGQKEPEQL